MPVALPPADLVSAYVVLIGAPFTAGWGTNYSGVDNAEWLVGPKRARQQSECYGCCIQDFDLDIFETLEGGAGLRRCRHRAGSFVCRDRRHYPCRRKNAMNDVVPMLQPIVFDVCVGGEAAHGWVRRNDMPTHRFPRR